MSDAQPKKRKHKTRRPPLSADDIRFARILFERGKKNVVDCYLEAGFPRKETDIATKQAAYRRVKNRHFLDFYHTLQDRAADAAQIDANMVLQALKRIAFFDLRQVFDQSGRIKLPHEWSDAVTAGVLAVESEELFASRVLVDQETGKKVRRKELEGHARKVKRTPPIEALKILAQVLRMIGQDVDTGKAVAPPLVVGGEADPGSL